MMLQPLAAPHPLCNFSSTRLFKQISLGNYIRNLIAKSCLLGVFSNDCFSNIVWNVSIVV
jgi:hypothetical protein